MKLSIIIPAYNVEKYLAKCLDSILVDNAFIGQVICINDGSTDNSAAVLERYAEKFTNLEIITQSNAGLSSARNAGIKAAKGEYVCFLDSDDYWEPNVLGGLMEQIERDKLDVLRFKFQNVRIVERQEPRAEREYEVFNPYKHDHSKDNDYSEEVTDGVTFLNTRMNTACYACQFILRRDLISSTPCDQHSTQENAPCLFSEGIYFEDTDWTPRMLIKAQRVASTNTIVYNYLQRQGSITNAINRDKQRKVLDDKMRLIGEMQRQANVLQENGQSNVWFSRMKADTVISVIGILSVDFYAERKSYMAQLQQMDVFPIQSNNAKAKLINLSPQLAVWLLHLKNKR